MAQVRAEVFWLMDLEVSVGEHCFSLEVRQNRCGVLLLYPAKICHPY